MKKVEFDDFSYYLHIPTRTDPSLAPEGHEVVYALVPVPNLASGTNWHEYQFKLIQQIKDTLEKRFLPGLCNAIVEEKIFSPLDFESTLNSHLGNAFGLEPHLMQTAAFRPSNKSPEVEGLYFVGANTQPGAGIPGVLLSARITSRLLMNDLQLPDCVRIQPLSKLNSAQQMINTI